MRLLLLATAPVALMAGSAIAADLPARTPAFAPAPMFVGMNWSGVYFGATAGGQWGSASVASGGGRQMQVFRIIAPVPVRATNGTDVTGFTGGLVLGYNRQYGRLVTGVELDANILANAGNSAGIIVFPFTQRVTSDWDARARLRLGAAFDRTLVYVASGLTVRDTQVRLLNGAGVGGRISDNELGWNVGLGIEYRVTGNWIGRVEYIYDSVGKANYGFDALTGGLFSDRRVSSNSNTVRAGVSYLFSGSPAPVVARY